MIKLLTSPKPRCSQEDGETHFFRNNPNPLFHLTSLWKIHGKAGFQETSEECFPQSWRGNKVWRQPEEPGWNPTVHAAVSCSASPPFPTFPSSCSSWNFLQPLLWHLPSLILMKAATNPCKCGPSISTHRKSS